MDAIGTCADARGRVEDVSVAVEAPDWSLGVLVPPEVAVELGVAEPDASRE